MRPHVVCLRIIAIALAASLTLLADSVVAQNQGPYTPEVGQPGKDVVWVPTPQELVERMMDLANVTPQDFVIDLGSGDGRNVISAAKRGARALGVEFNPQMVELSKQNAAAAGVTDKATFVEGDMFKADISQASVMALFLLPSHMTTLRPKFLALRPGSRIVSNTFTIEGWNADEMSNTGGNCQSWCTAYLWIVPANVAGTWRLPQGELALTQEYQMLSGSLGQTPISDGRMRGDQIHFTVGPREFIGRVAVDRMEGTIRGDGPETAWTAALVH